MTELLFSFLSNDALFEVIKKQISIGIKKVLESMNLNMTELN